MRKTKWALLIPLFFLPNLRAATVRAVEGVSLSVSDMDRSVDFYSKVLSFEKDSDREFTGKDVEKAFGVFGARVRIVGMKIGEERIRLAQFLAPEGRPAPVDAKSNDIGFQHIALITPDMDRAYAWLHKNKVRHASPFPQTLPAWNKNAGGIKAFYFKDPDGHPLEVLQFPPDKGDAKWRRPAGNKIFLGIDHTAIVISSTEKSLKFYRDVLGMKVVGTSENFGIEQERLNNVEGARLRITGLKAARGPGVEFLEYVSPGGGRRSPEDLKPNDIAATLTILEVDDPAAVHKNLFGGTTKTLANRPGAPSDGHPSLGPGFVARDPDGHFIFFRHADNPF